MGIDLTCGLLAGLILLIAVYVIVRTSDQQDLRDSFKQLNKPWYWTFYNIAEWIWIFVRMSILIPLVVFGQSIWQLYYLGFAAACVLTWTSIRKKLPEFTIYYGFWIWLASSVLLSHLIK